MGDRCFMDESRRRKTIFFDKNALFSLWFHLINLRHLRISICKDNQSKTNLEKADGVEEIDRADGVNKANKIDRANRADRVDRINKEDRTNKNRVDAKKPDGPSTVRGDLGLENL